MPDGLVRLQGGGDTHFITFSCYRRHALLSSLRSREIFEQSLEKFRERYRFQLFGYVIMPEHIHLLMSEPQNGALASAIQAIKQSVSRKFLTGDGPFWQERYYDFNVFTHKKHVEKLRYVHRNPVTRGLVEKPEDWQWSSFNHYATGARGVVEIASPWNAFSRERDGTVPRVKVRPALAQTQG